MVIPARLSESQAGRLRTAAETGTRRESGGRATHIPNEVSVMNKIIPTVLLAAAAALVACGVQRHVRHDPPGSAKLMARARSPGSAALRQWCSLQDDERHDPQNRQVVAQSALKVGEIARIKGSKNASDGTGNADSVDVDENVVGPIAAIDTTLNTLTVLGQTVKIDAGTSFSSDVQPADITGLKVADFVEVSGLTAATAASALRGSGARPRPERCRSLERWRA